MTDALHGIGRQSGGRNSLSCCRTALLILLFCFAALPACQAQNSIDQLVDHFSTAGSSKFTSVVERDPQTRRVQKVVKVLQLPGHQAGRFRDAFLKEQATGTFSRQQDADGQTMTLVCEAPKAVRIYTLWLAGRSAYHSAKVTIIVKML